MRVFDHASVFRMFSANERVAGSMLRFADIAHQDPCESLDHNIYANYLAYITKYGVLSGKLDELLLVQRSCKGEANCTYPREFRISRWAAGIHDE